MKPNNDYNQKKELFVLRACLVIGIICILAVVWLQYMSFVHKIPFPEYSLAFFSSIATLTFGYIFGGGKS